MHHLSPFQVIGVSHHTAALAVRERVALSAGSSAALLARARDDGRALVAVSTCNRTEVYAWGEPGDHSWLDAAGTSVVRRHGTDAARHLFSVAAGLDSQLVGESEILGQVRRAWDASRAAGTTCLELDRIFGAALNAGRRVRRETWLGRHSVSMMGAAVREAAREHGGSLAGIRIVVLGAGEAAEGAMHAVEQAGGRDVELVCRRPEQAQPLASIWGARVSSWESLDAALAHADLIVAATGAAGAVVGAARLSAALSVRSGRRLTLLDLGVPRNVEPVARQLAGIRLIDLDDLRALGCPMPAGSPGADELLGQAREIVDEELERLYSDLRARALAPTLAELHRAGERIAAEETARALRDLGNVGEPEQTIIRRLADRVAQRVLYPISREIKR